MIKDILCEDCKDKKEICPAEYAPCGCDSDCPAYRHDIYHMTKEEFFNNYGLDRDNEL